MIWQLLYKLTFNFYSLLLSQLPFSSLFESSFNRTNIQDSAVIWARAFSVAQNISKCRQSIKRVWAIFLMEQSAPILVNPLSWTPLLADFQNKPWIPEISLK